MRQTRMTAGFLVLAMTATAHATTIITFDDLPVELAAPYTAVRNQHVSLDVVSTGFETDVKQHGAIIVDLYDSSDILADSWDFAPVDRQLVDLSPCSNVVCIQLLGPGDRASGIGNSLCDLKGPPLAPAPGALGLGWLGVGLAGCFRRSRIL